VADLVQRGRLFGDAQRLPQRQDLHCGADLYPLGFRCDSGPHGHRRAQDRPLRVEVGLRHPYAVESQVLGQVNLTERLGEVFRLRSPGADVELHERAELHARPPFVRQPEGNGEPGVLESALVQVALAAPCDGRYRLDRWPMLGPTGPSVAPPLWRERCSSNFWVKPADLEKRTVHGVRRNAGFNG